MIVTSRMFHVACCALCRPALRPTRGSGRGAVVDVADGVAVELLPPPPPEAQAARASAATAVRRFRSGFMATSYLGLVVAGTGRGPNILSAIMRCIRSISVVSSANTPLAIL